MLFSATPVSATDPASSIWTTDINGTSKTDFSPGDIVYIWGEGFHTDDTVLISITRPDSSVDTGSAGTDSNGGFTYEYDLNGIIGQYIVDATDGTNSAQTMFTDAAIWTTDGSCGDSSQNVNSFDIGHDVYINGEGFDPSTLYSWYIKGQLG